MRRNVQVLWEYCSDFVYSSVKDFHFEEMNSLVARDSFSRCASQKLQLKHEQQNAAVFSYFLLPGLITAQLVGKRKIPNAHKLTKGIKYAV